MTNFFFIFYLEGNWECNFPDVTEKNEKFFLRNAEGTAKREWMTSLFFYEIINVYLCKRNFNLSVIILLIMSGNLFTPERKGHATSSLPFCHLVLL